jgi:hypothetical protein
MANTPTVGLACLLIIGTGLLLAGLVGAETAPPGGGMNLAKPETWDGSVSEAKDNLNRLANDLILVAKDQKRTSEDRVKAIGLLGRIGNMASLDFLVANSSLFLPLGSGSSREGQLKHTPCLYAIYKCGEDWAAAQAFLRALDKPMPEVQIGDLGQWFAGTMGITPASGIVAQELGKKPTPEREKNLLYLKRVIEGR